MKKSTIVTLSLLGAASLTCIVLFLYLNHKMKENQKEFDRKNTTAKLINKAAKQINKKAYKKALPTLKRVIKRVDKFPRTKQFNKKYTYGDLQASMRLFTALSYAFLRDKENALKYLQELDKKGLMPLLHKLKMPFYNFPELTLLLQSDKRYHKLIRKHYRK